AKTGLVGGPQDDSAGGVAEDDGGAASGGGVVHVDCERVGADQADGAVGPALDKVVGEVEAEDKAAAGAVEVEGPGVARAQDIGDQARRGRAGHVGRHGGADDEVQVGGRKAGGGEGCAQGLGGQGGGGFTR